MNWSGLVSSKRFLVALVGLAAAIYFVATGNELPQEEIVESILVLAAAVAGVLGGYVAKEKRRG